MQILFEHAMLSDLHIQVISRVSTSPPLPFAEGRLADSLMATRDLTFEGRRSTSRFDVGTLTRTGRAWTGGLKVEGCFWASLKAAKTQSMNEAGPETVHIPTLEVVLSMVLLYGCLRLLERWRPTTFPFMSHETVPTGHEVDTCRLLTRRHVGIPRIAPFQCCNGLYTGCVFCGAPSAARC